MFGSDLYIALVLGVTLSLIFTEKTGVLPAGLIVPGYLALVFDQPITILMIFLISILTYVIVVYGISKVVILYGRRKFTAMLITGIVIKVAFDYFFPILPFEVFELRGIGIIVPGLIANTMQKQGLPLTVGTTVLLSGVTFGIMQVYYLF
ncbi:poly-gamma-glutamate biosynthesis protein PgsC [Priestia megaterium]|jgi:gamma-polyglutamate biosynthesis protein CapC|uniref:Capsule biosynthesis protein CapC n=9 Tax=Priestia TaxID=2800373 RepID=D5E2E8_PRIM1|nr:MULTISPECIES: poly-gamma-glutamate biosynthesis protein PgsC [Priestia]AVX07133.1 poly-gamma-glutamate biosynthesis protein PgsC [Bacillus sp. Y-01]KOP73322.1 capsular biosynthesis protein [Bacillus sp. FJAT-21351]KQU26954.1 poly-gamma-glutamate biosynthesis protein PgsC [Bacillus sp. Leaf75]KRD84625.1 poly-gamma-glutamate biosynthesis protein PgsC [Bacillus sp. Root147]KRE10355.1 poly-gamma-glutamate biosynthesis protein PgsC [Bacillus sp. Root239]KRF52953.1 poly-gamma-glutamate biosynthe